MPTDFFQPITNPISGETFKCLRSDAQCYEMEWTVTTGGYVPFEHIHYKQDETFDVKEGVLRIRMDGKEHVVPAGKSITVAKGVAHLASNDSIGVLKCIVRYAPGLDYANFMRCFLGLTMDGYLDKNGGVNVPMCGYMIKRMKLQAMTRPTSIPAFAFGTGLMAFQLMGMMKGWDRSYRKYVG